MRFRNLEGKPEREIPNRTISASGGSRPLQIPYHLMIYHYKGSKIQITLLIKYLKARILV